MQVTKVSSETPVVPRPPAPGYCEWSGPSRKLTDRIPPNASAFLRSPASAFTETAASGPSIFSISVGILATHSRKHRSNSASSTGTADSADSSKAKLPAISSSTAQTTTGTSDESTAANRCKSGSCRSPRKLFTIGGGGGVGAALSWTRWAWSKLAVARANANAAGCSPTEDPLRAPASKAGEYCPETSGWETTTDGASSPCAVSDGDCMTESGSPGVAAAGRSPVANVKL
mmetsp:Transcript_10265/g.31719  ORF Transcript_10265/g.31719 Transcript_10265/m.31719 type:complete len:231 (-) Transcript_10265:117-809(-)